ncbi:DUF5658 family protein [Virgibacillus senegalensis]|uniref:DUF5658 family protein n=1 Tax=Virgibacillus senegalensis TaxID=1499679 RepID=UPI00069E8975|nr:DUF5658 family protein [Virgibacillus senegalensis]
MKGCFLYLALLNLLDTLITFFGIESGYISEANPLMYSLYQTGPFLFLFVKISLSFALVVFCTLRILPTSGIVKFLTCTAALLYSVICLLHGFWLWQLT